MPFANPPPSLSPHNNPRATVVEDELRNCAAQQNRNVDDIVNLVKENEAILKQTRVCSIISAQKISIISCECLSLKQSPGSSSLDRITFARG